MALFTTCKKVMPIQVKFVFNKLSLALGREDSIFTVNQFYYLCLFLLPVLSLINYDFAYNSTLMSFYDGKYYVRIPAGSLLPGFTYILEACSLVNNEWLGSGKKDKFFHKETFKFKVTE